MPSASTIAVAVEPSEKVTAIVVLGSAVPVTSTVPSAFGDKIGAAGVCGATLSSNATDTALTGLVLAPASVAVTVAVVPSGNTVVDVAV